MTLTKSGATGVEVIETVNRGHNGSGLCTGLTGVRHTGPDALDVSVILLRELLGRLPSVVHVLISDRRFTVFAVSLGSSPSTNCAA
ncbi:hypothetical protein [Halomonas sp. E19]|uniref:hypothetical protein n=1 Tax=Halomonas sp. E19 TaxID=3397247 RepID=UPI004033FB15